MCTFYDILFAYQIQAHSINYKQMYQVWTYYALDDEPMWELMLYKLYTMYNVSVWVNNIYLYLRYGVYIFLSNEMATRYK